jgi:hypothetical protein
MKHATRTLALTIAAAPAFGCYQYQARPVGAIRPEETIHVELSPAGSASLASSIGPNATTLDGRVLSVDSNRFRLALTQIARSVGPEEFLKYEPIDVPRASATAVTVRSVDRPRTLLAIGGLAVGILVARIVTNDGGISTSRSGPTSGTK